MFRYILCLKLISLNLFYTFFLIFFFYFLKSHQTVGPHRSKDIHWTAAAISSYVSVANLCKLWNIAKDCIDYVVALLMAVEKRKFTLNLCRCRDCLIAIIYFWNLKEKMKTGELQELILLKLSVHIYWTKGFRVLCSTTLLFLGNLKTFLAMPIDYILAEDFIK